MNREPKQLPVNPKYKDTFFRMLFRDKEELMKLYNAVNDSAYTDADQFQIVTLENAVYMNMKNDLAFLVDFQLHLYEHQSTKNPNMPLRNLFYVAKQYQSLVREESIYSRRLVKLPTPRFVVFYNGTEKQPEQQKLRLSDAYDRKAGEPELELVVTMFNINPGYNEKLKEQCGTLKEYMQYVERVRGYAGIPGMSLDEAVNRAVDECIREGILGEFLLRNKAEAVSMCIFEYDEEKEMEKYKRAESLYIREELEKELRGEFAKKLQEELAEEFREKYKKEIKEELAGEIRNEERIIAIQNMLEIGIPKEKIQKKYSVEEIAEAESALETMD